MHRLKTSSQVATEPMNGLDALTTKDALALWLRQLRQVEALYGSERNVTNVKIVLIVRQVEGVPKSMLRELLTCLASTCTEEAVTLNIVFTLQYPPQSRHELFEDELIERRQHQLATDMGFVVVDHKHEIYVKCNDDQCGEA